MGYIVKGQPVGRKVFQAADKSLQFFGQHLGNQDIHKRFRKAAVRTMCDFHHNTTTRPMTEEFLLAMNIEEQDVTAAEFFRTFPECNFPRVPVSATVGGRKRIAQKKQAEKEEATGARDSCTEVEPDTIQSDSHAGRGRLLGLSSTKSPSLVPQSVGISHVVVSRTKTAHSTGQEHTIRERKSCCHMAVLGEERF